MRILYISRAGLCFFRQYVFRTDNIITLTKTWCCKFVVTAADVIRYFAISCLGNKVVANPGTVNQMFELIQKGAF